MNKIDRIRELVEQLNYHRDLYFNKARPDISDSAAEEIRKLAGKIYTTLGCKGLSRVDFFLCENDRIVFNEINTLPGFTNISMYPKLFMHEGLSYSEIIDRLITLACEDVK